MLVVNRKDSKILLTPHGSEIRPLIDRTTSTITACSLAEELLPAGAVITSCCNGNHESLRVALSRDSIILWAIQTYTRRQIETPKALNDPQYAHLQKLQFRTPKQAAHWLEQIKQ